MLSAEKIQMIVEAALMCANRPLTIKALQRLFDDESDPPDESTLDAALKRIALRHHDSGIELQSVSGGYRLQSKLIFRPWLSKLWDERPPRYSQALLETLAIIAYKQPITRAEIEAIRGVNISRQLMQTLQEREWIRLIGHREVPGKPALYGTTPIFLQDFNLSSLAALPSLPKLPAEATVTIEHLEEHS